MMHDSRMIQALHAAISRSNWSEVERAANALRDDEQSARRILAGTDIGSLPHDMTTADMAKLRMATIASLTEQLASCERDRQERIEQCDRMAADWTDFCASIGITWDTHEAVAAAILTRFHEFTEQLAEAREALEPRGWFVKDDAYGWSHFDNEVDARLHSEATGGMILVGVLQIETSKTPTDRFAQWLNDGPKLAKAVGVYVGIKVSAQPYARATLSRLEKQEGEA